MRVVLLSGALPRLPLAAEIVSTFDLVSAVASWDFYILPSPACRGQLESVHSWVMRVSGAGTNPRSCILDAVEINWDSGGLSSTFNRFSPDVTNIQVAFGVVPIHEDVIAPAPSGSLPSGGHTDWEADHARGQT